MSNVWLAFGLTLFAGLATAVGSGIAFFARRTNYRFLAVGTGFSAGVMLYVSFVEILDKGRESLVEAYGSGGGAWANMGAFFGGMALIVIIDRFVPEAENPHEVRDEKTLAPLHEQNGSAQERKELNDAHLHRTGLLTAFAIGIHNFPEGLVTFLSTLQDPALGVAIAVAVAIHNVPEGISVSVPIYYATGNRKKAFIYSLLSGLSEPVGALVAYVILRISLGSGTDVMPPEVMGLSFAMVAGIMVYISLDELLPTSRAYSRGHDSISGLVAGMVVMAVSLLLM